MKGHHHRRRNSAVRLFVATWGFIAALCTAAVLTTWATTSDEPAHSARPPPRLDDTRRAVALALAPCAPEMQLCTAVTRDPFPRATGTAKDATVPAELRSVLGRTLATIRDDGSNA